MEKSLNQLELCRKRLHEQIESLGDFRRGSITANFRKCGKKNCACSCPGHPGHGPRYMWSATIGGKSFAKDLHLGPELEKVRKEVESHRSFVELNKKVVKVNEEICHLRPVEEIDDEQALEVLKKKLRRRFVRKRRKK